MMLNHRLFTANGGADTHLSLSLNHRDCCTMFNSKKWSKRPLDNVYKYYRHLETKEG